MFKLAEEQKRASYSLGARLALRDAGLLKEADVGADAVMPALFGALGGAAAAPEGKGWEAAGKTWIGGGLGSLAGGALGGAGGAGIGALAAALSKGKVKPEQAAALGGLLGLGTGALGGGIYGRVKGYQHAVDS